MLNNILKGIIFIVLASGLIFISLGLGSGKHKTTTSIEINAPIEFVYNYLSSPINYEALAALYEKEKYNPALEYFEKAIQCFLCLVLKG